MGKLQEGDVFTLRPGMKVSTAVPRCFIYSNVHSDTDPKSTTVEVGDVLTNKYPVVFQGEFVGDAEEEYDTDYLIGDYVVERTRITGGQTGRDFYPDGHQVRARKLNEDGSYDPGGTVVEFYQSGCFTNMISPNEVETHRRMEKRTTFT